MLLPSCTSLPPPFLPEPRACFSQPHPAEGPQVICIHVRTHAHTHTYTHVCMWGGGASPHPAGWMCVEHGCVWLGVSARASAFSVTQKWSE